MASSSSKSMPVTTANEATGSQDMFNKELETYRRIVAANLMFHREVYGLLRDLLVEHAPGSFRFLDVACGDAAASAAMLKTTAIGGYVGIDLSEASLRLADRALEGLPCPVELRCGDFAEAMANWSEPVDVIWIGMSLHHLATEGKARLMRHARRALGGVGLFVIWEPALFEGIAPPGSPASPCCAINGRPFPTRSSLPWNGICFWPISLKPPTHGSAWGGMPGFAVRRRFS
ncbi:class I SAM-dependent methyltransferase [Mesorhizobium kowhaii]|uniref:class I SAM-dependent methyltransferase n=1 Tax=Mesorhizobium kowhaii TaxID=1300272 RepID=UPI0035E7C43F